MQFGLGDPEDGLADGEAAHNVRLGWVRVEGAPERNVVGLSVGAAGEDQRRAAAGKQLEVSGVSGERPLFAAADVHGVASDDGAHARTVLKFVIPDALKPRGKQDADSGQQIEIEERVAVRIFRGQFVLEESVGIDLGANRGSLEAMPIVGRDGVVAGKARKGRGL